VLGRYVRDEQVITLPEAIRKLNKLPASNLKLWNRGELAEGYFADIVVFGPSSVSGRASFSGPHQFSSSMAYVIVNREAVIRDGEPTGALPAQIVRGPGCRE
jgi:N-acyl-D-amino-acid deacylase